MGETEVTQELFLAVMGTNPSYFQGSPAAGEVQAKRPVERVNWYDAIAFCNKLSLLDGKEPVYSVSGISNWASVAYSSIPTSSNSTWNAVTQDLTKNGYRLPTEMEWKWAAMGADKTVQPNTTGYNKMFAGNNGTNIIQNSWYTMNSSSKSHEVGKKLPNELNLYDMSGNVWEWCWDWHADTYRVLCGGSFGSPAENLRLAWWNDGPPEYRVIGGGFRLVCPQ
jgi:formylglycine-generating enzyme required for sulfatase activity